MSNKQVKISIRNLVEFVLRSGDLDSRFTGLSRMTDGIKLHQKLQKAGGEAYKKEVALSFCVETEGFELILEGRADGIIIEEDKIIIDEIKTTAASLEYIEESSNLLHWAQAMCYAYIYSHNNSIETITVQLTYCQLDTEEIKRFRREYSFNELEDFINDIVNRYLKWAKLSHQWDLIRDASIKQLEFPFPCYRRGQRELAVAAYKTITAGKKLYVQAPTGIGKTISTLFPAVKSIGEGHTSKIFYLTAKTITRQVAQEAAELMRDRGLKLKSITLTAKEKICFMEEAKCNPEYCQYAKGHFDRVNEAIWDVLECEDSLARELIEQYAKKHCVCPFEFALDLSLFADLIICDYNYLFDPRVYLKRFFLSGGDYAFLIDEAHNLVDRSREMFSAQLSKSDFLELKKQLKDDFPKYSKQVGKLNSYMLELKKSCIECGYKTSPELPEQMIRHLHLLSVHTEEWLKHNAESKYQEQVLKMYFEVSNFLKIAEFFDERYMTYIEVGGSEVRLKLFCLDPSYLISEALKRGNSAIFYSATMTPLQYFKDILGGAEEDYTMSLFSPFDSNKLCLMVADNISTRYRDREESYDSVAELIETTVKQRKGNYLVFFPSYKYMTEVYNRFVARVIGSVQSDIDTTDIADSVQSEIDTTDIADNVQSYNGTNDTADGGQLDKTTSCLQNVYLQTDSIQKDNLMYQTDIDTIIQQSSMTEQEREDFLKKFQADNDKTLVAFAVLGGLFGEGIDLKGERLIGSIIVGVGLPQVSNELDIILKYFNDLDGTGFQKAYMFPGMNKVLQAAGRVIRQESDVGMVLLIDERFTHSAYKSIMPEHMRHYKIVKNITHVTHVLQRFWNTDFK